jgi:hypothetical protein
MRGRLGNVRGGQPDSLMARLDRLQAGRRTTIRTRSHPTQRLFGIGLLAGGLIGAGAILAMPYVSPQKGAERAVAASVTASSASAPVRAVAAPLPPARESAPTRTAAAPSTSREAPKRAPAVEPPGPPPPLTMNLTSGVRGTSPFPLQVSNIPDADTARVILRDMPKAAQLTSGERRDDHTWSLRIAELNGLQVTLGEGTPEIFDIIIEVASASGTQIIKTGARVRLKTDGGSVAPRRVPATIEDLLRESRAIMPPPAQPPVDTPFHTTVTEAPAKAAPAEPAAAVAEGAPTAPAPSAPVLSAPAPAVAEATLAAQPTPSPLPAAESERKPLPEGRSALGGPVAQAEAATEGETQAETRRVWWKLPTPSPTPAWAPFGNASHQ